MFEKWLKKELLKKHCLFFDLVVFARAKNDRNYCPYVKLREALGGGKVRKQGLSGSSISLALSVLRQGNISSLIQSPYKVVT